MANAIETATLRDGTVVLAKRTEYGLLAVTYANHTQAQKRVDFLRELGIACRVLHSPRYRPFFVAIGERE